MPPASSKNTCMAVTKDAVFRVKTQEEPLSSFANWVVEYPIEVARNRLKGDNTALQAILISPDDDPQYGLSVIRMLLFSRPGIPVFFLRGPNAQLPFSEDELARIGVRGILSTSQSSEDIVEALSAPEDGVSASDPLGQDNKDIESAGGEVKYRAVELEDYISGHPSLFDVYVQISEEKYLKVCRKGEGLSLSRLRSYKKKGISELFVRVDEQQKMIEACESILKAKATDKSIPIEARFSGILDYGAAVADFLKEQGVSEESVRDANQFVMESQEWIYSLGLSEYRAEIRSILDHAAAMEHIVSTSIIVGILTKSDLIEVESPNPEKDLGLACFLHDVALYQLPETFWSEEAVKFSPVQMKLFEKHPAQAVEMLKGLPGMTDVILEGVANHHQRLNKRGFPKREGVTRVSRFAEIVGLADEISNLIRKERGPLDEVDSLGTILNHLFDGFSPQVMEATRIAFAGIEGK